jgi:hypothetical protein
MQNLKNKKIDVFWGPLLSSFDLNNMISTYTKKRFFMEKMAQICQVSKKKIKTKSKLPYFNNKFQ